MSFRTPRLNSADIAIAMILMAGLITLVAVSLSALTWLVTFITGLTVAEIVSHAIAMWLGATITLFALAYDDATEVGV